MTTATNTGWDKVGSDLAGLGLKLKLHFEQANADPDAAAEVRDALQQLGAALDGAFGAIGNAVRDDAVQADVRRVADSFGDALAASLREAGQDLTKVIERHQLRR